MNKIQFLCVLVIFAATAWSIYIFAATGSSVSAIAMGFALGAVITLTMRYLIVGEL